MPIKIDKIVAALFWVSFIATFVILFFTYYLYFSAQEQVILAQSFQIGLDELNEYSREFLDIRNYAKYALRINAFLCAISFLVSILLYFKHKQKKRLKPASFVLLVGGGVFLFYHLEFTYLRLETVLDDKGVEIYYYGYQQHHHAGYQRNPLFIASQAINYHKDYKKGDEQNLDRFNNTIDWLIENRTVDGEASYYLYDYEILSYEMKPPWKSGLANSRVLLAFLEAHKAYDDEKYLEYAHSCVLPYTISVDDGGFLVKLSENSNWYAEYPRTDGSTPMVLNGMMSIVLALNEYQKYAPNELAQELLRKGMTGLKEKLPEFDNKGGSYYDLKEREATKSYHLLHISLLNQLYEATGEELFLEYHDK